MCVLYDIKEARVVGRDGKVIVQRREGDRWVDVVDFDPISSDFAYTDANEQARKIVKMKEWLR